MNTKKIMTKTNTICFITASSRKRNKLYVKKLATTWTANKASVIIYLCSCL